MTYLVLARKYRPQTFAEVIQQRHVTQTLSNAVAAGRLSHAILLSGPRGTGKTTIARILAKAMNCKQGPTPIPCNQCRSCQEIGSGSAVDVFEIDGASNNGVEQVRELRENTKYMPAYSPFKIYIIDEVHMLSTAAFNALLKTLEEPPAHIIFLFATTEPRKIPVTILSRCQRYDLKRIGTGAIIEHMQRICQKENIDIPETSLDLIAREAEGSMRDALSLLDQVATGMRGSASHEEVVDILGVIDRKIVFDMTKAIIQGDVPKILVLIDDVYRYGYSITDFYGSIIEHFRDLLVIKLSENYHDLVDLPDREIERIRGQVADISPMYLSQILEGLFQEESNIKRSSRPKTALEVAVIRIVQLRPVLPIEALIEKIDGVRKNITVDKGHEVSESRQGFGSASAGGADVQGEIQVSDTKEAASTPLQDDTQPQVKAVEEYAAQLEETWQELLQIIARKYPSIAPNLAHSKLRKLTHAGLEIEVNGSLFNYNRVSKKDSLYMIRGAVESFFGKDLNVAVKAGKTVDNTQKQRKQDQANQLKQDLLRHPLVADAIEIFNGRLVDVKIT